jgi:thiol-disulfide isomerase/thioredoxin
VKIILLIFLLISLAGCESGQKETVPAESSREYNIVQIDEKDLAGMINDRKGKALFINVWATWCVPCVEEFPDIIRTSEYIKDKDVDFISLNVDMGAEIDSAVVPFLRNFNAGFPVYNVIPKSAEKVINLLNDKWNGAIPATFIYDKSGDQKIFILGSEKYENFVSAIDSVRSL